jgi:hypothetical protein
VTEVGLQRSGIEAFVGQGIAASMPQHMRMDLEADLGFFAGARQKLGKARGRERSAEPVVERCLQERPSFLRSSLGRKTVLKGSPSARR